MSTVRWALAGFGSGGRVFHAPLISSAAGLELAAVVTRDPGRREQVAAAHPGVVCVDDLAGLVELGVQGVTVTTPSATHTAVAREALDLGLAVVVDKPFALTAEFATELVAHAQEIGGRLTVYQNRRWDSDFLTVRRLVEGGELGTVHRFTSRIDRFRPVKAGWSGGTSDEGGGTLLDLGPHLIDQAVQLLGPVVEVHADLRTVRPGAGAEDDVELHLTHVGGVHSTLAAGMATAAGGPRFQVSGDRGGFLIDGFDVQESQLKDGGSPASLGDDWGVEPESAWGVLTTAEGSRPVPAERGRWDTYYPTVAAWVAGNGPAPVDPLDAVHTAAVIDAARISAAEGSVEGILVRPH
ncbi:gfo/Idh/MocA family oxidoreductase [Nakamurella sp. YIM 132087]|uniref:Gfo/Idh/MocA family oxidoreductase n=1 Tax=Nakamurella alba TaxID=2665158 RepID=A0A7K1FRT6_9ACTN|nr:Gfo/Idh/MocA family oxidoreductase [Nakamurella alba]MTD16780.1 gfo/Idh/MocA family oxidoreductase [Nakamurella alba]